MKQILMIATGGTIAAQNTENGLAPQLSASALLRYVPSAQTLCNITCIQPFLLDSTDIQPSNWLELASSIEQNYRSYDGFVITHGTDTLSFTAAALSYLIQGAAKPIVLTGAQRPIDAENTDAIKNLGDAIFYAVHGIGGVSVVFGGKVIAGTRAKKMHTKSNIAFESVNFPYLAEISDGQIRNPLLQKAEVCDNPVFYHALNARVGVLQCTPGMPSEFLLSAAKYFDALVLEGYGLGGVPAVLQQALAKMTSVGTIVAVGTAVPFEGTDMSVYRVGRTAKENCNLLELRTMTTEAAVAKLMWILAQTKDMEEVRRLFEADGDTTEIVR